jgi:hypothetical protein
MNGPALRGRVRNALFACALPMTCTLPFSGCESTEAQQHRLSQKVYSQSKIQIDSMANPSEARQVANIVAGEAMVFLRSEYTDWGEEGSGQKVFFEFPADIDSLRFSPNGRSLLVFTHGTGFLPYILDTLSGYDLTLVKKGDRFLIRGNVGNHDISGNYMPIAYPIP